MTAEEFYRALRDKQVTEEASPFEGTADDQRVVWKPLAGSQELAMTCPAQIIVYHGSRGPGKGLPLTELVSTPTGLKPIGSLKVGEPISTPFGVSSVVGKYPQGIRPTYRIVFTDGTQCQCDDQHIWPAYIDFQPGVTTQYQLLKIKTLITEFYLSQVFNTFLAIPTIVSLSTDIPTELNVRFIKDIYATQSVEAICIKILDSRGLFLLHDDIITHNTDAQLMRFRSRVGQGYGRHWRGIILDRRYKNLDDLVSKTKRWFPEFADGAKFNGSTQDYKWTWPTGEELLFRAASDPEDYWNWHGQEFPFIGWNELTKQPDARLFDSMLSCCRSSYLPTVTDPDSPGEIPLEIFATCNPHGPGHNWVKRRFIDASPPGVIHKSITNVFNPRTQKREDIESTQVHIFGSYRENIYLSPQYVATLEAITDPNKKKAWLQGDWDVVAGGMFDDMWDSKQHIVPPFKIPIGWRIDRAFDWGSSAPFSVGWWAMSDGSDIVFPDGTVKSTVRGDLFRIAEWYGSTGNANEGLRMLAVDVSRGILKRELAFEWGSRVAPGPADTAIWNVENGNSIAADMARPIQMDGRQYPGIQWMRSDKKSGSRIAGWEQIRRRLTNSMRPESGVREYPGLFTFSTCKEFIQYFPSLPRDDTNPDDVDTDAEDHIGDEVRYRVYFSQLSARTGKTIGT